MPQLRETRPLAAAGLGGCSLRSGENSSKFKPNGLKNQANGSFLREELR